jgi:hypothetical protein
MSADVAAVLERAADVIVERGWCQGVFHCGSSVCAVGAISVVVNGDPIPVDRMPATDAFDLWLHDHRDLPPYGEDGLISDWNDEPGRTADEVITALRECAAAERASP